MVRIKFLITTLLTIAFYLKGMCGTDSIPYGKWEIYKYSIGSTPVGLSNKEIKGKIGKYVLLYRSQAVFIDDTCNAPKYNVRSESEDYFVNYLQINKSALGIKRDSVYVLSLDCETAPIYKGPDSPNFSSEFIVFSKTELIVNVMGVYFYLKKIK